MKKVLIVEATNGYVVGFAKYFGDSVVENSVSVHNELAKVQQEITEYFQKD